MAFRKRLLLKNAELVKKIFEQDADGSQASILDVGNATGLFEAGFVLYERQQIHNFSFYPITRYAYILSPQNIATTKQNVI